MDSFTANFMTRELKVNCQVSRRIPIQWESLDADWELIGIKHRSRVRGQTLLLQRVWQCVFSTLGIKRLEDESDIRLTFLEHAQWPAGRLTRPQPRPSAKLNY